MSSGYPSTFVERSAKDTGRTRTALETHTRKFNQHVWCFCLSMYKFSNFLKTWRCSINTTHVHWLEYRIYLYSSRNTKERSSETVLSSRF